MSLRMTTRRRSAAYSTSTNTSDRTASGGGEARGPWVFGDDGAQLPLHVRERQRSVPVGARVDATLRGHMAPALRVVAHGAHRVGERSAIFGGGDEPGARLDDHPRHL